jgi:hypothetical protein
MRVYLAGYEDPGSDIAFPEGPPSDHPPFTIQLENGVPFLKAFWVDAGYTNYEVWCVGGSGGQGGGVGNIDFLSTHVDTHMSDTDWALHLELAHIYNDPLGVHYSHWDEELGMEVEITMDQYYEEQNPNHEIPVYTYRDPYVIADYSSVGGAGGGGGLQVVTGLLDDLPDSCDVVVGQAGSDVGPGQTEADGSYTPGIPYDPPLWDPEDTRRKELENYFSILTTLYPLPNPSLLPPQSGNDGEASSFGDTLCQASGGKGGNPAKKWESGSLVLDRAGGDGGIGGQTTAGGGGTGATTTETGSDGVYDPVTGIGEGGGGGHGGGSTTIAPPGEALASDGGRGSFSLGFTSIYGARASKKYWYNEVYSFDPETGDISEITHTPTGLLIIPGGGGGVRALRKFHYGSRAEGYNPNGLVAIRLTKVE